MENNLEQLLNRLIEKGWLPRWDKNWKNNTRITNIYFRQDENGKLPHIRMIVSKESNLWQFVCDREHRFIDKKNYEGTRLDKRLKNPYVDYDGVNTEYEWITGLDYQYRLIESSLKDESELEDFLLNSIKLD